MGPTPPLHGPRHPSKLTLSSLAVADTSGSECHRGDQHIKQQRIIMVRLVQPRSLPDGQLAGSARRSARGRGPPHCAPAQRESARLRRGTGNGVPRSRAAWRRWVAGGVKVDVAKKRGSSSGRVKCSCFDGSRPAWCRYVITRSAMTSLVVLPVVACHSRTRQANARDWEDWPCPSRSSWRRRVPRRR